MCGIRGGKDKLVIQDPELDEIVMSVYKKNAKTMYYTACQIIRQVLFFRDISTKKMSTTMYLSSIDVVQMTHASCNFHQLSFTLSRDMAKISYLGVPNY